MSEQTNAQRLDEIRWKVKGTEQPATGVIWTRDEIVFLLRQIYALTEDHHKCASELDEANQTIARQDTEIQELWEQKRIMSAQWLDHEATIKRLSKTIAEKDAEIERLERVIIRCKMMGEIPE